MAAGLMSGRPFSDLQGGLVLELVLVVAGFSVGVADKFLVRPLGVFSISSENRLLRLALVGHDVMTSDDAIVTCTKPFGAHLLTLNSAVTPEKVRRWMKKVNTTNVWLGGRTDAAVDADLEPGFPGSIHEEGTQCVSLLRDGATMTVTSTSCQRRLRHALCRLTPDSPRQTFSTSHGRYHVLRDKLRDHRQGASKCQTENMIGLASLSPGSQAERVGYLVAEYRTRANFSATEWLWVNNTNTSTNGNLCLALHIHGVDEPSELSRENCDLRLATLCEELPGPNVALGKHVYASSLDSSSTASEFAVTDDRLWTSKTTRAQIKPWMAVDLGFQYDVTAVIVTFSKICTNAFHLLLPRSRGRKSVCQRTSSQHVASLNECMALACRNKSQVFNYRSSMCVLTCADPLHIVPSDGPGWDIYYTYNATINVTVQDEIGSADGHATHCDVINLGGFTRRAPHVATCLPGARGQYVRLEVTSAQARVLDVAEVNVKGSLARRHSLGNIQVPCSFPFLFKNATYRHCLSKPEQPEVGRSWCAVSGLRLDSSGSIHLLRPCLHVRLVAGRSPAEGLLETATNGTWWRVTSEGWTHRYAQIVCRQLGYRTGRKVPESFFPADGAPVVRFEWLCDNKTKILDACGIADEIGSGSQPLQWKPEYETVGAVCDDGGDSPMMVGLPAFGRSRVDESHVGIVVMSQVVRASGLLVSWTIHFSKPGVLTVFLLRPVIDNYTKMVAASTLSSLTAGLQTLHLTPHNQTLVFRGDRIGFLLKNDNPVPYDVVDACADTPHFSLYGAAVNPADESVQLKSSDVVLPACRLYSLFASITEPACSPFSTLWNTSKYTSIGQTLRYRDAVRACAVWEGANASLLTIGSVRELAVISDWLSANKSQPNYWVIPSLQVASGLPGTSGASAAAPGCNILHRTDKRRKFVFDLADCSATYPVICEQLMLRPTPQAPPSATTAATDHVQPTKWHCHLAIGFGVFGVFAIVICVIICLFLRRRYRCHLFWRKSFVRARGDSEATLAVLSPAAMEQSFS